MEEKRSLALQGQIRLGGLIKEFKQSEMHSEMVDYFEGQKNELDHSLRGCTPEELPAIQSRYIEIESFFEWMETKETEGTAAIVEMEEDKSSP